MRLMSTSTGGLANRSFINGSKLWPPASTLASALVRRRSMASSTDPGAAYLKDAGITGHSPPRSARPVSTLHPATVKPPAIGSRLQYRLALRSDDAGIEAEPVHAPHVSRVLDFHAAVHHHL